MPPSNSAATASSSHSPPYTPKLASPTARSANTFSASNSAPKPLSSPSWPPSAPRRSSAVPCKSPSPRPPQSHPPTCTKAPHPTAAPHSSPRAERPPTQRQPATHHRHRHSPKVHKKKTHLPHFSTEKDCLGQIPFIQPQTAVPPPRNRHRKHLLTEHRVLNWDRKTSKERLNCFLV